MQKMTERIPVLPLFLTILLLLQGCGRKTSSVSPEFAYKFETRADSIELRATLKTDDFEIISLSRGWGVIDWMADEGLQVASGEVVVRVDMSDEENSLRNNRQHLETQVDNNKSLEVSGPAEQARLEKILKEKQLDLQHYHKEENWLRNSKKPDEIWKIHADFRIASISFDFARQIFELQREVTSKGFDSAFTQRSKEIDLRAREIELSYARRLKEKLNEPPDPDELAKVKYQQMVASGEIWLSQNQLQSVEVRILLQAKNYESTIEKINSLVKNTERTLENRVLKAPRSGTVLHPIFWGDMRFRPGIQAWPGAPIMHVVGDQGLYLEALAHEADSNRIVDNASATIEFDALPGKVFTGVISSIGKSPRKSREQNSNMKFFPVKIDCKELTGVKVGSKAKIKVILAGKAGVFIPRDALIQKDAKFFVKTRTTFGESLREAEVEDFDPDWVVWKNAPDKTGTVVLP